MTFCIAAVTREVFCGGCGAAQIGKERIKRLYGETVLTFDDDFSTVMSSAS